MKQDCQLVHIPNLSETCCLRHLIEMYDYSQDQTLSSKYVSFFIKTVLVAFKSNSIQYSTLKLETTNRFMEIVTKQICHFFMINNIRMSKMMVNVALDIYQKSYFKAHSDILLRTSAVYNNVACVYFRQNHYRKAVMYFNHYKKSAVNTIDQLIFLNNTLTVLFKQDSIKETEELMEQFHALLTQEVDIAKKDKVINKEQGKNNDLMDKCKLLSFMLYNYAFGLEKMKKIKEAKENYKKGYVFSLCNIGEYSFHTTKFIIKLEPKKEVSFGKNKGSSTIKLVRSKTPNRRNDLQDIVIKEMDQLLGKLNRVNEKHVITEAEDNTKEDDFDTKIGSDFNKKKLIQSMNPKTQNIVIDASQQSKKSDSLSGNQSSSSSLAKKKESLSLNEFDDMVAKFREEEEDEKKKTNDKRASLKTNSLSSSKFKDNTTTSNKRNTVDIVPLRKPQNEDILMNNYTNDTQQQKTNNETSKQVVKPSVTEQQTQQEAPAYQKTPKIKRLFQKVCKPKEQEGKLSQMIHQLLDKDPEPVKDNKNQLFVQEPDDISFNTGRKMDNLMEITEDVTTNPTPEIHSLITFGEDKEIPLNTLAQANDNKTITMTNIAQFDPEAKQEDDDEYKYSADTLFQTNNILLSPKIKIIPSTVDYQEMFNKLISNSSFDKSPLIFVRIFDDIPFIIHLLPQKESFHLSLMKKEVKLYEFDLEYRKIKPNLQKMSLMQGLPPLKEIGSYRNIEEFSKFFIQFILLIKSSHQKYKFGLSPNPIGIIGDKRIEFKFLKYTCLLDILFISMNQIRIIITNCTNPSNVIRIDCKLDNDSFSSLISKETYNNPKGQTLTGYSLSQDQLSINGFIPRLSNRLQEILKLRLKDPSNEPFESLYNDNINYQCIISNNLQVINTWIAELKKTNKCNVSYYQMKRDRLSSTNYEITDDEFIGLFGLDQSTLNSASSHDKALINQFIINKCIHKEEANIIQLVNEASLFSYSGLSKSNKMCCVELYSGNDNEVYAQLKCFDTETGQECKRILFPSTTNQLSKEKLKTMTQSDNIVNFKVKLFKACDLLYNEDIIKPFDIFDNVFE